MKKFMNWFKDEESGQGMVEYGLIIVLVSLVAIVALTVLGGTLNDKFDEADDALKTAAPSAT